MFYTDKPEETVETLKNRGVEFTGEVEDEGWGLATAFKLPDGSEVQLYEPKYEKS
jgi:hypothetical protein